MKRAEPLALLLRKISYSLISQSTVSTEEQTCWNCVFSCLSVCVSPTPLRYFTLKPSISSGVQHLVLWEPSPGCPGLWTCELPTGLTKETSNRPTAGASRGAEPSRQPRPAELFSWQWTQSSGHVAINQAVIRSCIIWHNPSAALIYQLWTGKKESPLPLESLGFLTLSPVFCLSPQSTRQPRRESSLRVQVAWP